LKDDKVEVTDATYQEGRLKILILRFIKKCHPDKFSTAEGQIKLLQKQITQMLVAFLELHK